MQEKIENTVLSISEALEKERQHVFFIIVILAAVILLVTAALFGIANSQGWYFSADVGNVDDESAYNDVLRTELLNAEQERNNIKSFAAAESALEHATMLLSKIIAAQNDIESLSLWEELTLLVTPEPGGNKYVVGFENIVRDFLVIRPYHNRCIYYDLEQDPCSRQDYSPFTIYNPDQNTNKKTYEYLDYKQRSEVAAWALGKVKDSLSSVAERKKTALTHLEQAKSEARKLIWRKTRNTDYVVSTIVARASSAFIVFAIGVVALRLLVLQVRNYNRLGSVQIAAKASTMKQDESARMMSFAHALSDAKEQMPYSTESKTDSKLVELILSLLKQSGRP